jgi:hypothetical protein
MDVNDCQFLIIRYGVPKICGRRAQWSLELLYGCIWMRTVHPNRTWLSYRMFAQIASPFGSRADLGLAITPAT